MKALRRLKKLPPKTTLEAAKNMLIAAKTLLRDTEVFKRIVHFVLTTLDKGGFNVDELEKVRDVVPGTTTRISAKPAALCAFFPGEFPWTGLPKSSPNRQPIQVSSAFVSSTKDGDLSLFHQLAITLRYIFVHVFVCEAGELTIGEQWKDIVGPNVVATIREILASVAHPSIDTSGAIAAGSGSGDVQKRNFKSEEMGNLVVRMVEAIIGDTQKSGMVYTGLTMGALNLRQMTISRGKTPWMLLAEIVNDVKFAPPARIDCELDPTAPPPSPYTPVSGPELQSLLRDVRREVGIVQDAFERSGQNASTLEEMNVSGTTGEDDGGYGTYGGASFDAVTDKTVADFGPVARTKCRLNPTAIIYVARLLLETEHGVHSRVSSIMDSRVQELVECDLTGAEPSPKQTRRSPSPKSAFSSAGLSEAYERRLGIDESRLEFEKDAMKWKIEMEERKMRYAESRREEELAFRRARAHAKDQTRRITMLREYTNTLHQRLREAEEKGNNTLIEHYQKKVLEAEDKLSHLICSDI